MSIGTCLSLSETHVRVLRLACILARFVHSDEDLPRPQTPSPSRCIWQHNKYSKLTNKNSTIPQTTILILGKSASYWFSMPHYRGTVHYQIYLGLRTKTDVAKQKVGLRMRLERRRRRRGRRRALWRPIGSYCLSTTIARQTDEVVIWGKLIFMEST